MLLAVGGAVGCGGSSDGGKAAADQDQDRAAPYGDARLIPLLLTADDYERGLVPGDGRRARPAQQPLCRRADLPATWTSEASMMANDPEPNVIGGASESILQFRPGAAATWFATLKGCANLTDKTRFRYTTLPGIGDEALVSVPAEYHQAVAVPLTIAVVRTGDRVVLVSAALPRADITDALITKAVTKATA